MDVNAILAGLNASQKEAVARTLGPFLILAGPGAGKTLTIVRRIASLVRQGVRPESILAVTFTNRAAREMQERTQALLGDAADRMFIGTFHLLGLRIIRECLTTDVVLLDRDEQIELLKSLLNTTSRKARLIGEKISRTKNSLGEIDADVRGVYEQYQAALQQRHAFDFDDLIGVPAGLLEDAERTGNWRLRFRHVIVDEYQDINPAQYRLLRLLTNGAESLCAVGDPDQAIYAFRGADIGNFLRFEEDFPKAARITLSENYRSCRTILHAADGVIRNNVKRIPKELLPTREQGRPVNVISVPDDRAESAFIIREIENRMGGTSHERIYNGTRMEASGSSFRFSDFAVLFRTNAQARALEEAFQASGIPYQMIGKRGGIQRKTTDDMLAWLHILASNETGCMPSSCLPEEKLLTPADLYDPRADAVALMTLHMAKGLEFPVVFITGCEDELLPCALMKSDCDVEEERRLFFVGMTRAEDELYLLHARSRLLHGERRSPSSSPFLREIPQEMIVSAFIPDAVKRTIPEETQLGLF